jgi:hypothetical protein
MSWPLSTQFRPLGVLYHICTASAGLEGPEGVTKSHLRAARDLRFGANRWAWERLTSLTISLPMICCLGGPANSAVTGGAR